MKKKIFVLFVCAMMTLAFTACGSESSSDGTSAADSDTAAAEENEVEGNGEYITSILEAIGTDGSGEYGFYDYGTFSMLDSTYDYIEEHSEYFPLAGEAGTGYESAVDESIDAKKLNKSFDKYSDNLIKFDGTIAQIQEQEIEEGNDITQMLIATDDDDYYAVYIFDSIDVYEDDYVSCIGLPISISSFDNVDGGTTNYIAVLGCEISKQ